MIRLRRKRPPALGSNATLRPSSQHRFADRARRRRLASLRPLLIGVAVVAVLAIAGWTFFASTLLAVHSVKVSGQSPLAAKDIAAIEHAAQVPYDKPLALLDAGAIRRRVAAVPQVQSVTVDRSWPSSVHIAVVERTPAAVVQRPGKPLVLIDRTGVIFADVAAAPTGLAVLSLATPSPDDPSTMAAIDVVDALPSKVRATVATVSAPTPASVTLKLAQGVTVIWGDATNSARKAQVLAALLSSQAEPPVVLDKHGHPLPPPAKPTVFDVSSPEVATVR